MVISEQHLTNIINKTVKKHLAEQQLKNKIKSIVRESFESMGGFSQFEASDLEAIGLLKMDFLGINNLTMVAGMLRDSNMTRADLLRIPLDVPKVFRLLQNGDILILFFLELCIKNFLSSAKWLLVAKLIVKRQKACLIPSLTFTSFVNRFFKF